MADRVKRSVSMPPDVDAAVAAAAAAEGLTYSAWLARTAAHEIRIRAGLEAMAAYEAEHGAFTDEETADARRWVDAALAPLDDEDGDAVVPAPPVGSTAAGGSRRATPAA